jgi:hypothetical protein
MLSIIVVSELIKMGIENFLFIKENFYFWKFVADPVSWLALPHSFTTLFILVYGMGTSLRVALK